MKLTKRFKTKKLKKTSLPLFIGALVVLIPIIYLSLNKTQEAEAAWWDDTWTYRKKVTFGNTGSSEADKKVKFNIIYSFINIKGIYYLFFPNKNKLKTKKK